MQRAAAGGSATTTSTSHRPRAPGGLRRTGERLNPASDRPHQRIQLEGRTARRSPADATAVAFGRWLGRCPRPAAVSSCGPNRGSGPHPAPRRMDPAGRGYRGPMKCAPARRTGCRPCEPRGNSAARHARGGINPTPGPAELLRVGRATGWEWAAPLRSARRPAGRPRPRSCHRARSRCAGTWRDRGRCPCRVAWS